MASEGYTALQLGCGAKRDKQLNRRQLGHYRKAEVDNKRKVAEFRVTEDALLPVGFELTAAHFVPGQFLDIAGTTIGKGFQGVMKKHGFKGQPASHGNSLAHRAPGGIGACQDPGKVWPGKKMPGRMGCKRRTVQSVWVYQVSIQACLYLLSRSSHFALQYLTLKLDAFVLVIGPDRVGSCWLSESVSAHCVQENVTCA